ncbi:MAG: DUF6851 domain-containing protein [Pseudomonadota bacterium]
MEDDQSLVAVWNEVMLNAIRSTSALPTPTTYQLHLVTSAMYDAWAALSESSYGQYSEIETTLEATDAVKEEAISYAAYTMLSTVFSGVQELFDAQMEALGYDIANVSTDPATAAGLGNLAAANVLAARADDGSNFENGFADTSGYVPTNSPEPGSDAAPGGEAFDPNAWQPLRVPTGTLTDENGVPIFDNSDPASFVDQLALTPHWGSVTPFALTGPEQFRAPPPPQLGDFSEYVDARGNVSTNDAAYRAQAEEVLQFSADLTTEQKVIAEFWADGPRTEAPPGHWNQIAQDIALREGHGIDEDVQMFFALNAAIFDAGITTWGDKYFYDYVRPQSAIRDLYFGEDIDAWAGPNLGTQTIQGEEWQPYQNVTFVTPPFPEFGSGHSAFSMAAARTIASYVGSDAFFDGETLGVYDLDDVPGIDLLGQFVATELVFEEFPEGEGPVTLQWETLTEAALEAGVSRLYGGIHFQDGNEQASKAGEAVAANAEIRWDALFTRGGDDDIAGTETGGLAILGAGDDTFAGSGAASDEVEAGSGDDEVNAGAGDDRVAGEAGNDEINGGAGRDTAVYTGASNAYVLRLDAATDLLTVTDMREAGDGADQLEDVELVEFADGFSLGSEDAVDLTLLSGALDLSEAEFEALAELYVGYLDRAPDVLGLLYWGTELAVGTSLSNVAATLHEQQELPASADPGAQVDAVYQGLFERDADAAGRAYWVSELESGALDLSSLTSAMIEGAKAASGSSDDAMVLADKVQIALTFALEAGLSNVADAAEALAAYDSADAAASLSNAADLIAAYRAEAGAAGEGDLIVEVAGVLSDPLVFV